MIESKGKNEFKNGEFDWHDWSAGTLQTPDEIRQTFANLDVQGKTIIGLKAIGLSYAHTDGAILDYLLPDHPGFGELLCGLPDEAIYWIHDQIACPCYIQVDEPLILFLDDGGRIECDFSEGSCVRLSKSCIPPEIKPGINRNNIDASVIFAPCVGEKILGIDIKTTEAYPLFTGSHGLWLPEDLPEYVDQFSILLGGGKRLCFSAYVDYGSIWAEGEAGTMSIPFGQLKGALYDFDFCTNPCKQLTVEQIIDEARKFYERY